LCDVCVCVCVCAVLRPALAPSRGRVQASATNVRRHTHCIATSMWEHTKHRGQVNEYALCRRVQARYVACGEQPWAKPQHTRAAVGVVAGVGEDKKAVPTDDTTPNKIHPQKKHPTLFVHVHPHTHLGCKCVRTHLPQFLFAQDVAAGWRKRSTANVRQAPTVESLNRPSTFVFLFSIF
jgi:hypothetical protein